MLAISILLGVVVVICAAQTVCIERLYARTRRVEKENAALRLAVTHWEREAHAAMNC